MGIGAPVGTAGADREDDVGLRLPDPVRFGDGQLTESGRPPQGPAQSGRTANIGDIGRDALPEATPDATQRTEENRSEGAEPQMGGAEGLQVEISAIDLPLEGFLEDIHIAGEDPFVEVRHFDHRQRFGPGSDGKGSDAKKQREFGVHESQSILSPGK